MPHHSENRQVHFFSLRTWYCRQDHSHSFGKCLHPSSPPFFSRIIYRICAQRGSQMYAGRKSKFLSFNREIFFNVKFKQNPPKLYTKWTIFLKGAYRSKTGPNKSHGTHLGIELVLPCLDLVTTTPLSKSSLETCQDFALLSPEEQKESWHWANKAPSHQSRRKSPLVITGTFIKLRLSWKKFWFWYRVLPESHEAHRCQILRVPRITLQLAQFLFFFLLHRN